MEITLCRICLQADGFDEEMRSIYDGSEYQPNLQSKLKTLGFLQVQETDGFPTHLCGWCASRVDDAFDLKQQCERSRDSFLMMFPKRTSVKRVQSDPWKLGYAVLDLSLKASSCPPEPHQTSSVGNIRGSAVVTMLGNARKMMACLRNFSAAMKCIFSVLNEAITFSQETFASLRNMFAIPSERFSSLKTILTVQSEAEDWWLKSAMVEEVAGLLHLMASASHSHGSKGCAISSISPLAIPELITPQSTYDTSLANLSSALSSNTTQLLACDVCSPPTISVITAKNSEGRGTEKSDCPPPTISVLSAKNCEIKGTEKSDCLNQSLFLPLKELRRSNRGKGRQSNTCEIRNDCATHFPQKSPVNDLSSLEMTVFDPCTSAVPVESQANSMESVFNRKSRKRRKRAGHSPLKVKRTKRPEQRFSMDDFDDSVEHTTRSSLQLNDDKDIKQEIEDYALSAAKFKTFHYCLVCGKQCESKVQLRKHSKTHSSNPLYPCNFCEKEFSSAWNRTQHERCHTGQKPYECDLCGESFRYNVSMRNHKARVHLVLP